MNAATETPFLALRGLLDQLAADLRAEASREGRDARRNDLFEYTRGKHLGAAQAFARAARRVDEAVVRAAPRCRGEATVPGYDESWQVTCPGGCGAILEYQRFLVGAEHGRFTDGDCVLVACGRCGHDLEAVEPDLDGPTDAP